MDIDVYDVIIVMIVLGLFLAGGFAIKELSNEQESINTFITQDGISITITVKKEREPVR